MCSMGSLPAPCAASRFGIWPRRLEVAETLKEEEGPSAHLSTQELEEKIKECEKEMRTAAKELRFEDAAHFRDLLKTYQQLRVLEDDL